MSILIHHRLHMTSEVAKQRSVLGHKARWNYTESDGD